MPRTVLTRNARIVLLALALVTALAVLGGPAAEDASAAQYTVSVHLTGAGKGTVDGPGVWQCNKTSGSPVLCNYHYTASSPAQIFFYAMAAGASSFGGWSGACAPSPGPPSLCAVYASGSVTAPFASTLVADPSLVTELVVPLGPTQTSDAVQISGAGAGNGTVTGPGINCTITGGVASSGGTCAKHFSVTTPQTRAYTASAAPGHSFTGWSGACSGTAPTCSITGSGGATARFDPLPPGPGSPASQGSSSPDGGQGPGGGDTAGGQNAVQAELLSVEMRRSKRGKRIILVEIHAGERLRAFLALERRGNALLTAKKSLEQGERRLTLVVPNGVSKGKALLVVTLADADGVLDLSRRLRLPRA